LLIARARGAIREVFGLPDELGQLPESDGDDERRRALTAIAMTDPRVAGGIAISGI